MLDHQGGQTFAIEKDDPLGKALYEVARLSAERGSSDKYALARAEPDKATHKSLHVRPTDGIPGRVALGLNVDAIEPQPVFVDHTVDAPITRSAELGSAAFLCDPPYPIATRSSMISCSKKAGLFFAIRSRRSARRVASRVW